MRIIQVHKMDCKTVAEAEHALQASWAGDNVWAFYNGVEYRLYADTQTGETHEALMKAIDHDNLPEDINDQWKDFYSYPLALIDVNTQMEVPSILYTLHLYRLDKSGRCIGKAFVDKIDFLVANGAFMSKVAKREGRIYRPIMGKDWGCWGYKGVVYQEGKEVLTFCRMHQAS